MSTGKWGIAKKLVAVVLTMFLLAFTINGVLVYFEVKTQIESSTQAENKNLSQKLSKEVEKTLDAGLIVAQTLAKTMEADIRGSQNLSREDTIAMLENILSTNPNLAGIYLGFEPNAFDGKDSKFINSKYHDATGRFIPYVNKLTGKVTIDPLEDYEKAGVGDYYLLPKKTGQEQILEPYLYQGVLLTSLVVPIKDTKGNFVGIAGVDISLNQLDEMISKIKVLETGNASLVSSKGIFLADANKLGIGYSSLESLNAKGIREAFEAKQGFAVPNPQEADIRQIEEIDAQTSPAVKELYSKLAAEVRAGKSGMMEISNRFSKELQWTFYEPVKIGGTNVYWGLLVNVPPAEALAPLKIILRNQVTIALLAIVLVLIVIISLVRRVIKPIGMTVDMLKDIAEGEGDLTKRITITSNDETGELAKWFNLFIEKLAHTIIKIKSTSETVSYTSEQLSVNSQEASKATQNVATAIVQVAKGSSEQSSSVADTVEVVRQVTLAIEQIAAGSQVQSRDVATTSSLANNMSAKIDEMAEGMHLVKEISEHNGVIAESGGNSVAQTVQGMLMVKNAVFETAQKVHALGEQSQKIGEIVDVISDIAEQTNLLALNAAIEAARAGEHGKGFAVVADEVRKLAERSGKATKEIATLIANIQQGTTVAVESMQLGTQQVEDGVKLAQVAGQSLNEIVNGVKSAGDNVHQIMGIITHVLQGNQEMTNAMNSVATVTEENTAATEEILASTDQVNKSVQYIAGASEQNASVAQEVSASTEELTATIEEMSSSSERLAKMAQDLNQVVAQFKV